MIRSSAQARFHLAIVASAIGFGACNQEDDSAAKADAEPAPATAAEAGTEAEDASLEPDAGIVDDAGPDGAGEKSGPCGAGEFDSTFAAIQRVIFEGGNCTNSLCHGEAAVGGLDLRAGKSYANLIEMKSTASSALRVMPGEPDESFLYNKLRAATEPGSVTVEGSAMPSGAPPLSREHLEALRRWIEAGAPREGSIGDSITGTSDSIAELLGSCLPEVTPIQITPLAPPAVEEGLQIPMAPFTLPGAKEVDVCFAQYYDVSDVVPPEYQDPQRGVFFVNGQRTRQDPHSHHLVVRHSGFGADLVKDPSFGAWACRGGSSDGQTCDPLQRSVCGGGLCASEPQHKAACIGYGPMTTDPGSVATGGIATAQTAQYYRAPRDGLYETIPIRGILYMNSHAFNLTSKDTQLHAWINLFYAKDRRHAVRTLAITDKISIAHGQAPFTKQTHCATWTAPLGSTLYTLSSHTHKRGGNFIVKLPDGTQIYQSAIYSDPIEKMYDPPIHFDAADPSQRTLTYCAEYNNGVAQDGKPDTRLVTKLSTMPDRTSCMPVACTAGKIGAACKGANDDATCDSAQGVGDGVCDACTITAGQTTENEMFALSPSVVLP
jgi:hypothetical protein